MLPLPVVAVLWATGAERTATDVPERWTTENGAALVLALVAAVWLPADDVTPA